MRKQKKLGRKKYGTANPMQAEKIKKKSLKKREELGLIKKWTRKEIESYKEYKHAANYYANQNYIEYFYEINPDKLKRGTHDYHLDHIFPVIEGWLNDIPPKLYLIIEIFKCLKARKIEAKAQKQI